MSEGRRLRESMGRPAPADDVFEFVRRYLDRIDSDDFMDLVDDLSAIGPRRISAVRLGKFLERNARDAWGILRSLL